MKQRLIVLSLAIFLLAIVGVSAEGPIACDVFGYVNYEDGSPADPGLTVKIVLRGEIEREDIARIGPPPAFTAGFYGISFSQIDHCNYGDVVQVEAESGNFKGASTCHLSEYSLRDLCNIVLTEEKPQIILPEEKTVFASNVFDCMFSGYVTDNYRILDKKAQITIDLNGKKYTTTTHSGPPPEMRNGYYYTNLGNLCKQGDPVVLTADDGYHYGTINTDFNSNPSASQYNLVMDKKSVHPEIAEMLAEPMVIELEPLVEIPSGENLPLRLTRYDMFTFSLLLIILVIIAFILKLEFWSKK